MIFAHDYAVPAEAGGVWPQCDALRDLLRQLLVVTLINDPHRYRLEAYRWLSEILLLLTSRFQQPARMLSRELSSAHSKRIARVIERINASYSRRITLAEIAAVNMSLKLALVSFARRWGSVSCSTSPTCGWKRRPTLSG